MGELSAMWDSIDRLGSISTASQIILTLLVLLSFFFSAVALVASWRKDALQRNESLVQSQAIADTNERAGKANERAELANERATKLELDVETARLEAERERLARVKIEERLAPRRLLEEQKKRIVSRLLQFKGQRINVLAFDGDPEIVGIANDVLSILSGPQGPGWVVTPSYGREFGLNVFGLGIEIQRDADDVSRRAAAALVGALNAEGFQVHPVPALPPGSGRGGFGNLRADPAAKIRLIVGVKPEVLPATR